MTTLDFRGIYEPVEEVQKLKEENLKLKQKLEVIRTMVVDIFDRETKKLRTSLILRNINQA